MRALPAARHLFLIGLAAWPVLAGLPGALAQEQGIVAVDESPTAGLMVTQMLDQVAGNPDRSARLAIEILDSLGSRLVMASEEQTDLFVTARSRVEQVLLEHPDLLARFVELQEPDVERLVRSGSLARAVDVGWLTPSGSHASMILAQTELESGHVHAARDRLERLGDNPLMTPEQESHRQLMLGAVGALTGELDSVESARSALSNDDAKRARLDDLVDSMKPLARESIDTFDGTEIAPLHDEDWHEVWSYPLPRSPMAELLANSSDASEVRTRALATLRSNGRAMTAIPLVADDMVFVNDGGMIQGFDRFGSGTGWEFDLGPHQVNIGDMYVDPGELAYSDTALVAIPGVGQNSGRTANPEVICLDPRTGALKWRRELGSIRSLNQSGSTRGGFDFSRAFPYGGLLIESGRAVFTVRKVNSRRETVLYLVALDVEDGSVEWVRFLGSSGGLRTNKGFSRITSDRGSILVSSPVGVVARVNPLTGDPHWLRRFDVPIARVLAPTPPWEISQPVSIDDRIYALAPNRRQIVQLGWDNGALEDQWTIGAGSRFGDPKYLVLDDHDPARPVVYAVGSDIHALEATRGLPLRWRFSGSASDEIAARTGNNRSNGTRGRVQATSGTLVVPGDGDVVILAAEDGSVLDVLETEDTSNPVLLESQLILAGNDRVSSLMQVGRAEQMLRERIRENPDQLSRVLGLMELGVKSGRIELAFEAARFAVAGLEKAADSEKWSGLRGQLISMLLDLSRQTVDADIESSENCLRIADQIAVTHLQRAQVRLALAGMCLRQGRDRDGLLLIEELLGDAGMSTVLIPRSEGSARASILARMLVGEWPSAVTLWDSMANQSFSAVDDSDPLALRDFAGRYPGTRVAAESLIIAASLLAESGLTRPSMECLLDSIREHQAEPELAVQVLDLLVSLDMREVASRLALDYLQRPGFTSDLAVDGLRPLEQSNWITPDPLLGDQVGTASLVAGNLLPGLAADGVYVFLREQLLFRLEQPDAEFPIWEVPVSGKDVDYAWGSGDDGVLNLVSFEGSALFTTISIADGRILGASAPFIDLFPVFNPDLNQRRGLIPGGGVYRPESLLIDQLDDDSMLVLRRNGDMAMYSAGSESDEVPRLLWKHRRLLDRVYEVVQDDRTVVVAGRARRTSPVGEVLDQPVVVLIDAVTGEVITEFAPASGEDVRWVKISPSGLLLLGTRSGIEARSLSDPDRVYWNSIDRLHRGTTRDRVVVFGNRLVVVRSATTMSAIDLVSGELVPGRFELPDLDPGEESTVCLALSTDPEGITVLMNDRVLRWTAEGLLAGVDAIAGSPSFIGLFRSAEFDLVLEELERSGRTPMRRYWLHRLDPDSGLRISGPTLEFESNSRSIGPVEICPGWILLQAGAEVLAIPMPVPESTPR